MFDMDKIFSQNDVDEIVTKDTIKVTAKTVTPLLQLDSTGKQRSSYVYENDRVGLVPFFSANGFRGALRRVAFKQQVEVIKKKEPNFKISPEMYYLYTSGAALDRASADLKKKVNYATENKVRKNALVLSLFGAGLSELEGKLAIADLFPSSSVEKFREIKNKKTKDNSNNEEDTTSMISNILSYKQNIVRSDSYMSSKNLFSNIMDLEDIRKWRSKYYVLVAASKLKTKVSNKKDLKVDDVIKKLEALKQEAKKNDTSLYEEYCKIDPNELYQTILDEIKSKKKSDKEENSHIQQIISQDFIIPGITLTSSINPKYGFALEDEEVGCIISALAELSLMQIGSSKRIGFGVLEWTVEKDGEILFSTKSNPDYVLQRSIYVSKKGKEYISKWQDWLDKNASKIDISTITEQKDKKETLFD